MSEVNDAAGPEEDFVLCIPQHPGCRWAHARQLLAAEPEVFADISIQSTDLLVEAVQSGGSSRRSSGGSGLCPTWLVAALRQVLGLWCITSVHPPAQAKAEHLPSVQPPTRLDTAHSGFKTNQC